MTPEYFIGAMSGTSVDGIDVALVRFTPQPALAASQTLRYPEALRRELLALAVPGENEIDRLGRADAEVGRWFARAIRELLAETGTAPTAVRAIGSHGQTVRHRPNGATPFTLQIGDPNVIAAHTGIPVAADFRRKDVALGGQGAPLVPAFHEAVFRQAGRDRAVVNIGGIANVTVLPGDAARSLAGFDTGPGNTLLDGWSRRHLNEPMDRNGAFAASGRVQRPLLTALRGDAYFVQAPPKSTGPEHFSLAWLDRHLGSSADLIPADVQATLLALTADSIADAVRHWGQLRNPEVFVCGGGARNPELMRVLQARLPASLLTTTDALGVPSAWVEAIAFAWLARQRLEARPGNHPNVTGAARPAVLGGLWLPE